MSHTEFRAIFTMLARALANQANKKIVIPPQVPSLTTRVTNFIRMSPPEFHGPKMEEELVEFIDEAYRIVAIMGIPSEEKAELVAYQLHGVANIWYKQCRSNWIGRVQVHLLGSVLFD